MLLSGNLIKALSGLFGNLFSLTVIVVLGLVIFVAILSWNYLKQSNKKKVSSNK